MTRGTSCSRLKALAKEPKYDVGDADPLRPSGEVTDGEEEEKLDGRLGRTMLRAGKIRSDEPCEATVSIRELVLDIEGLYGGRLKEVLTCVRGPPVVARSGAGEDGVDSSGAILKVWIFARQQENPRVYKARTLLL